MSGGDIERVNVVAASAEQAGDPGQDAEFVFDKDGDGMAHDNSW